MSISVTEGACAPVTEVPEELLTLRERVRALPPDVRVSLEPVVGEALEQAVYRTRVLAIAREALVRFRHDLELVKFDLDATRREREILQRRLES
ncbi:MAG TPA: hypothetical protein VFT74_05555 [Isosphaeraceae bacterium]|nr:hypothetical protein [Isosphaeraceae bacterium]